MRTIYCLLLLLCPCCSNGQPVRVGDKVPDIKFGQIVNSKEKTITLSQLKGKLVLLDFWATWCGNCIKKFGLLDSLQQQYDGKLQVILVSQKSGRDTKDKIEQYLNKHLNAAGKKYCMPAVFNDTLAGKYFPHSSLPFYVWIGPNGECLAITNSDEVTAENVSLVIAGKQPRISGLALMEGFDFDKPLFANGNAGDGSGLFARSSISAFIPGMAPLARYGRNEQRLTTQYKMINQPLLELLKKAYSTDVRTGRVVFNVPDSIKARLLPATPDEKRNNTYTYELLCPPVQHTAALAMAQQDMKRYFGLAARWEKMPAPCYTVTVDSLKIIPYLTRGGRYQNKLYDPENKYLQNGKLSSLVSYLNNSMGRYVVLQAPVTYMLDIRLPDLEKPDDDLLIQALADMGIILKATTLPISQFIIYHSPKQSL